jgi:hypothetical protein
MICSEIAAEMGTLVHRKAYIRGVFCAKKLSLPIMEWYFQLSWHGILLVSGYKKLSDGVVLDLLFDRSDGLNQAWLHHADGFLFKVECNAGRKKILDVTLILKMVFFGQIWD